MPATVLPTMRFSGEKNTPIPSPKIAVSGFSGPTLSSTARFVTVSFEPPMIATPASNPVTTPRGRPLPTAPVIVTPLRPAIRMPALAPVSVLPRTL